MANDIKNKSLYEQLGNIKKVEQWLKACEVLGFRVCRGTKHPSTIRNPKFPQDTGRASLITVVPNNLHRIMNQNIFKDILRFGVNEDDIWRALDML